MGITRVAARVSGLNGGDSPFEADFLVDTGAIDCMVPEDRLAEAGVRPEGRAVYELANGESVEYAYGFARIAFMDAETVGQIAFGPPGSEPILGVVALESAGMTVDPLTRTLKRLPTRPMK